jgi:hypothetical protein
MGYSAYLKPRQEVISEEGIELVLLRDLENINIPFMMFLCYNATE